VNGVAISSTLVSELRTSSLGPKQYYELYMAVFDALRHLSVYLKESHPVNHLADLYELVQYAGWFSLDIGRSSQISNVLTHRKHCSTFVSYDYRRDVSVYS
jgi:hypothetical protein